MTTEPTSSPAPKPITDLAEALASLGRHAASMDQRYELAHESCVFCEQMKLLSRVVKFGDQLRTTDFMTAAGREATRP